MRSLPLKLVPAFSPQKVVTCQWDAQPWSWLLCKSRQIKCFFQLFSQLSSGYSVGNVKSPEKRGRTKTRWWLMVGRSDISFLLFFVPFFRLLTLFSTLLLRIVVHSSISLHARPWFWPTNLNGWRHRGLWDLCDPLPRIPSIHLIADLITKNRFDDEMVGTLYVQFPGVKSSLDGDLRRQWKLLRPRLSSSPVLDESPSMPSESSVVAARRGKKFGTIWI